MPLDHYRLKELCERLLACDDDEVAVRMAEELRNAMHEHIEELRRELRSIHAQAS